MALPSEYSRCCTWWFLISCIRTLHANVLNLKQIVFRLSLQGSDRKSTDCCQVWCIETVVEVHRRAGMSIAGMVADARQIVSRDPLPAVRRLWTSGYIDGVYHLASTCCRRGLLFLSGWFYPALFEWLRLRLRYVEIVWKCFEGCFHNSGIACSFHEAVHAQKPRGIPSCTASVSTSTWKPDLVKMYRLKPFLSQTRAVQFPVDDGTA